MRVSTIFNYHLKNSNSHSFDDVFPMTEFHLSFLHWLRDEWVPSSYSQASEVQLAHLLHHTNTIHTNQRSQLLVGFKVAWPLLMSCDVKRFHDSSWSKFSIQILAGLKAAWSLTRSFDRDRFDWSRLFSSRNESGDIINKCTYIYRISNSIIEI